MLQSENNEGFYYRLITDAGNCNPLQASVAEGFQSARSAGPQPVLCYAPFRNLYIDRRGNTYACSYNRIFQTGNVFENSLEEIWKGQRVQALRAFVSRFDTGLGCSLCAHQLRAGNYAAAKPQMWDHVGDSESYPAVLEFSLSNICNLECKMCVGEFSSSLVRSRHLERNEKCVFDEKFFDQLKPFLPGLREAKFYGGEPFLCEEYFRIWEMIGAVNPACRITVQTNATVFNAKVEKALQRGNFHLCASLDATRPALLEQIRKGSDFGEVMKNVDRFKDYAVANNNFFGITVSPTKYNTEELPLLLSFCNNREIPIYFTTIWFPLNAALWNLPSAALIQLADTLEANKPSSPSAIAAENEKHYHGLILQIRYWADEAKEREVVRARFDTLPYEKKEVAAEKRMMEILSADTCISQMFLPSFYGSMKRLMDDLISNADTMAARENILGNFFTLPPEIMLTAAGMEYSDLMI